MAESKTQGQRGGFNDFTLVEKFPFGYRNREDITVLPPGVMVDGSLNVLTNTFQRIGNRKGYTLDGQPNDSLAGIRRSFDWFTSKGFERNMRAGGLTSAGDDGFLQYRYVDDTGTVSWRDLVVDLTSVDYNFTTFWDFNTELIDVMLAVNGASEILEWSGGITTAAAFGVDTITTNGILSWAELGFYVSGTREVVINGNVYEYDGGEDTTILENVTPSPIAEPIDSIVHQEVRITANSAMTDIPDAFPNALIANLRNQIYVGSLTDNSIYVSKVDDYKDYSFTDPRTVGEGAIITPTSPPTALIPQESSIYISAGKDEWYETEFILSSDNAKEALNIQRLSTTSRQATQSQLATSKIKNSVVFLSFEPIMNSFGRVDQVVLTPQMSDLSWTVVNDFDRYNFTDAAVFYFNKYVFMAVPGESRWLMYNMTDPKNPYWECPQTGSFSCFSVIDGEIYAHSSVVPETYKLFDGYNDNGNVYFAQAAFSFNNYGTRSSSKGYNEFYLEGYITANTTLNLVIQYDIDGCATTTFHAISGSDSQIVCITGQDNSLGKWPLGKQPLGSVIQAGLNNPLPPKFRVIKTFPIRYFYEDQIRIFTQAQPDVQWEIVAFGPQLLAGGNLNNNITQ